jgi:site-specific recombinase XerD
MYKNTETGFWEHDFRVEGVPRYHVSYGAGKKSEAEPLHITAMAVFRAKQLPVIEAVRRGDVTWAELTQLRLRGEPYANALVKAYAAEPWPLLEDAIETYLEGIEANPNRSARTGEMATSQLNGFVAWLKPRLEGERWPIRLDEIVSSIVNDYQSHLVAQGFKTNTITAYVSRVGSLFHWFRRREEREARERKRPARSLHVPLDPETVSRTITRRERFLSPAEAERLLAATPSRLLFHVAAGLFGGFRIDEVCHFRRAYDVDLELGVLSVQRQPTWKPKTKRSVRHVPIAAALRRFVEQQLKRASDEWLVPSFPRSNAAISRRTCCRVTSGGSLPTPSSRRRGSRRRACRITRSGTRSRAGY